MNRFLKKYIFPHKAMIIVNLIIFFILFIARGHYLYLGGEGNYFLNPVGLFNFDGYSWKSLEAAGHLNPLMNFSFLIFHLIWVLNKAGISYNIINLLVVYLIYILPLLSMYWLAKGVFKLNTNFSVLIAMFYILNPFSVFHLQGMMFWNIAPLVALPIFFGIIFKFYQSNIKLFLYLGTSLFIASFSFANIPYIGIFQIFIIFSLIIIPILKKDKFNGKVFFLKLLIIESSFIIFGAWWLLNLIRIQTQEINSFYTKEFAVGWAKYASGDGGVMHKLFSFKALIGSEKGYFFSDFYNNPIVSIILILPFLLLVYFIITEKNKLILKNISLLAFILLVIMFLNKGVNKPFSLIYIWMLEKVPLFIIFKSPLEKFSLLFLFFFVITIFVLSTHKPRIINYILSIYLMVAVIPFITLNFIPDFSIDSNKYVSRKFVFKDAYRQAIERLNSEKLYYRYLSLPGSSNYQVTMSNHENKYYRGMDPILYAINKPFIAAYSGPQFDTLYKHLSSDNIENVMGAFNIRKIMINKDIIPSFGFVEKERPEELKALYSKKMENEQFGSIGIYTLNSYIPLVYSPTREIYYNNPLGDPNYVFSKMISGEFIHGSILVPKGQEKLKENNIIDWKEEDRPIIEFKKINEVKYRAVIHGLKKETPLVFSESFNKGWKLYQVDYNPVPADVPYDNGYKDSASKEEIAEFINKRVVKTTVNESGKADYISKIFNRTIQNDNLEKGKFYESWFKKPVQEEHLMVNGYANSWKIDPNICKNNYLCKHNADGSYELELIIEFWPQRLYYLGVGISGLALLFVLYYLIFIRSGRKNSEAKI